MTPIDPAGLTGSNSKPPENVPVIERLPPDAADPTNPSLAYQACLKIRRIVFVDGQSIPVELEFDGLDEDAIHFIALGGAGRTTGALGTARMRTVDGVAKAERFAVLEEARGLGIGRALVEAIETAALEAGLRSVKLNAQVQAAGFYEKLGFVTRGDIFFEAGIDHHQMTKRLA